MLRRESATRAIDTAQAEIQTAVRDEARKEHAAEIISFLDLVTNGNWRECLDIAQQQRADSDSALWLAVCDGLRALIRQDAVKSSERLHNFLIGDVDVPY